MHQEGHSLSHIRPCQDHQFSSFLASVTKAVASKNKTTTIKNSTGPLESSVFLVGFCEHPQVSGCDSHRLTTRLQQLGDLKGAVPTCRSRKKRMLQRRRRTLGRASRWDLGLGPPPRGSRDRGGCATGHYHPSTRGRPSLCGIPCGHQECQEVV